MWVAEPEAELRLPFSVFWYPVLLYFIQHGLSWKLHVHEPARPDLALLETSDEITAGGDIAMNIAVMGKSGEIFLPNKNGKLAKA